MTNHQALFDCTNLLSEKLSRIQEEIVTLRLELGPALRQLEDLEATLKQLRERIPKR